MKDIENRVLKVVGAYDKVTANKVIKFINYYFCFSFQTSRWQTVRNYSAKEPLTLKLIEERVLLVLKLYDKVEPTKVRSY